MPSYRYTIRVRYLTFPKYVLIMCYKLIEIIKMEGNILSLLQQGKQPAATAEPPQTESKWKHSKLKHDVLSNKKDFPLANAKPAKKQTNRGAKQQRSSTRWDFTRLNTAGPKEYYLVEVV